MIECPPLQAIYLVHLRDRLATCNVRGAKLVQDLETLEGAGEADNQVRKEVHAGLLELFTDLVKAVAVGAYARAITQITRVNGHRGEVCVLVHSEVQITPVGIVDAPTVLKHARQACSYQCVIISYVIRMIILDQYVIISVCDHISM
jgi:hypothetical protein